MEVVVVSADQSGDPPTLADDEAMLMHHANALVAAVDAVVGEWVRSSIASRSANLASTKEADQAVADAMATITAELRTLLSKDIEDQTEAPLQVLRRGVRFATAVLEQAGVPAVDRDEFEQRAFPDDRYGLAPAAFGDVDESLHEPGLIWGAAKAHVHLRRRREAGE